MLPVSCFVGSPKRELKTECEEGQVGSSFTVGVGAEVNGKIKRSLKLVTNQRGKY